MKNDSKRQRRLRRLKKGQKNINPKDGIHLYKKEQAARLQRIRQRNAEIAAKFNADPELWKEDTNVNESSEVVQKEETTGHESIG